MVNKSPSFGTSQNLSNFKRRAFELCLAVWRVTKLFPPGEPLANQLKETSLQIIIFLAAERIRDTILKVEEIKIFLEISRAQNWLKPINFDLLISAYSLLADALTQQEAEVEKPARKIFTTPPPEQKKETGEEIVFSQTGQRQKQIIDYLKKNRQAKVSDLLGVLNVSERTIRNDLADLIKRNLVKKIGSRKGARYILI